MALNLRADGLGRTLHDLIAGRRYCCKTFCHLRTDDEEEQISFAKLFREASRFRRLYEVADVPTGANVLIATDFSADGMYAFIGALIGGFVPAFLAPFTEKQHLDQFVKTIAGIAAYARPRAFVVSAGFKTDLAPAGAPLIVADRAREAPDEPDRDWVDAEPDDVAFMQFSSGTTGLRKGVMLHHRAIVAQIQALDHVLDLRPDDLIASWLPLYHDMGLIACFVMPLALGVPLALQDPVAWARQPSRLFEAIERHEASHVWLPNFAFNHLRLTAQNSPTYDLSSVRAFINCSEPCKPATVDAFVDRFSPFGVRPNMMTASYAMAEAVFAVTQSPIGRENPPRSFDRVALQTESRLAPPTTPSAATNLLSTGRLLPSIELRVLDEKFQTLEDGKIGQIALRGAFIFKGYFNNEAATAAQIHDGWFLTGDLGAMLDGELYITGRLKDIVIVNGRNFYAHDVEACVSAIPGVKAGRATAFAIDNDVTGSEEVVVIAETALEPSAYRDLSREIKRSLADALGLTAVRPFPVPIGWIIKTTSGKISRSENREKYLAKRTAS